jgi:hypothetical protein
MKIVAIKSKLWFFAIMLLALSFPLQVYFNSPLPCLFPYLLVIIIVVLDLTTSSAKIPSLLCWNINKSIELVITIYVILVLFQTGWQIFFNFISAVSSISAIVIFIFPLIFFIYFRNSLTEKEIRSILFSMALAGLIVGGYFAYDSISKLIFRLVPEYAKLANNYSIERMGQALEKSSQSRIGLTARSMGLLEKHSVSAAWVSIGCFAALSFLPHRAIVRRILIISSYGVLLILGLNFTGIVGFLLVVFLVEFNGYYLLHGVINVRSFLKLIFSMSAIIVILFIILIFKEFKLIQVFQEIIEKQYDVISGTQVTRGDGLGYFAGLLSDLISFPFNMLQFPPGILVGDGFTTEFGVLEKGGDYGFVETLHRLGLPLFFVIFIGIINLSRRSLQQIRSLIGYGNRNVHYLQFASSVIIYILFTEIHYSIWSAKSILPVFFFCLAIFSCYLPIQYRRNSNCRIASGRRSMQL